MQRTGTGVVPCRFVHSGQNSGSKASIGIKVGGSSHSLCENDGISITPRLALIMQRRAAKTQVVLILKAPVSPSPVVRTLRFRRMRPHPSRLESVLLLLLVALVLLMPVNYRAGTDASHPHTIFQGLIDMVTRQPHHHHGDHDPPRDGADHAGTANLDGGSETSDPGAAERIEPHLTSPDMPSWLGLSSPIDATAAIHALGALVAAILGGSGMRSLCDAVRVFSGLTLTLDPPPPRIT